MMPAICRNCYTLFKSGLSAEHCIKCHQKSLLKHPELLSLEIAHIDCDSFYASVEKRDHPHLKDKAILIGGDGPRSVVCTACYNARAYGARSAMPMYKAKKLCPDALIIPPNFSKYKQASAQIREIFLSYTDLIQPLSLDEAYLDLSKAHLCHKNLLPIEILLRISAEIRQKVGITVSIGFSANKFLAKLASDLNKPNGFSIIGQEEAEATLAPMPITKIFGVGQKTAEKMNQMGFHTISDLQKLPSPDLMHRFGKLGKALALYVHGHDDRPVKARKSAKTFSNETTFSQDISDFQTLKKALTPLCQKVSDRLTQKEQCGRTIVLKLKTSDFNLITRNYQLSTPTNSAQRIEETASYLLRKETDGRYFRLIGVGLADLDKANAADPPELFDLL